MVSAGAICKIMLVYLCGLNFSAFGLETSRGVSNTTNSQRNGRLFSVFQVVRFENKGCIGSSKNGTCYTNAECTSKGGTSAGSCASGYGVCCVFALGCGSTSSQNCTYFDSTGGETGSCRLRSCKCNSNICQLRLDFNTFMITGPSTATMTVSTEVGGQTSYTSAVGVKYSLATVCLTDQFSVTNPGGSAPPTICGMNTGQHMYVDAANQCNELSFELGQTANGASLANRQWSIKITQFSCDYKNLAPEGCTQYYFGNTANCFSTYNYAGNVQLANQDQNTCVRKERGFCKICWYAANAADVSVSGMAALSMYAQPSSCCGYGKTGLKANGFDCISIPGAAKTGTAMFKMLDFQRQCGRGNGLVTGAAAATIASKTVCSSQRPFSLRFISDGFEAAIEATAAITTVNKGFRLCYYMTASNC